jgi:hypothetical protein
LPLVNRALFYTFLLTAEAGILERKEELLLLVALVAE